MGKFDGKISEYPLGERIRYMRRERGFTQVEMAKSLKITQGALSQIEKGQLNLTLQMLLSISDFLKIEPAVFFAQDDVFVFDIKNLSKYKKFSDLPPSLKRGATKVHLQFKKWGLR